MAIYIYGSYASHILTDSEHVCVIGGSEGEMQCQI
jgi:adenine deaminase